MYPMIYSGECSSCSLENRSLLMLNRVLQTPMGPTLNQQDLIVT